jgi:hypothetical protein
VNITLSKKEETQLKNKELKPYITDGREET